MKVSCINFCLQWLHVFYCFIKGSLIVIAQMFLLLLLYLQMDNRVNTSCIIVYTLVTSSLILSNRLICISVSSLTIRAVIVCVCVCT